MTHTEGTANTTALIELQHVTDTPANLAVPPNAAAYPYCDPPENPNPVSLEDPPYPKALASRKGSPPVTVVLGCYIDTSGNVRKEEVLSSAGKDWDEAAVIGASRWKFSPAACRGTPVPLHSVFTINFVKR